MHSFCFINVIMYYVGIQSSERKVIFSLLISYLFLFYTKMSVAFFYSKRVLGFFRNSENEMENQTE